MLFRSNSSGDYFIVGFRSRRSHGDENGLHRSHEGEIDGSHAARYRGHVAPPLMGLRAPFVHFLCPQALFLPNIDARKFAGDLDVVWVPETLKERNRVFCLCRVNSIKNRKHIKYSQNHYKKSDITLI